VTRIAPTGGSGRWSWQLADPRRIVQNRSFIFGNGASTVFQHSVVSRGRKLIERKKEKKKIHKIHKKIHITGCAYYRFFSVNFHTARGLIVCFYFPLFSIYRHIPFFFWSIVLLLITLSCLFFIKVLTSFPLFPLSCSTKSTATKGESGREFFHSLLFYPKIFLSLVLV